MGEGAGREDSDKKTPSPFVAALSPPPPLPIIDRYTVRSLRASSPIEPRESRASGWGKAFLSHNPRFRVSFRVSLARLLFTISPRWRVCSQAKKCDPRQWLSVGCSTIFGGEFWRFKKRFQKFSKGGALVWALDCNQSGPRLLVVPWG